MDVEGVVQHGVVVLNDPTSLPEGTRVLVRPADIDARPFGERFAAFKGAAPGLPTDLAEQHEHYRLGLPKR